MLIVHKYRFLEVLICLYMHACMIKNMAVDRRALIPANKKQYMHEW